MNRTVTPLVVIAAFGVAGLAACSSGNGRAPAEPADILLTNGRVVTLDEGQPEAAAVSIRGDRIHALGSADEMSRHVGRETQVIDLQGQLVIPGFIEGHGHFMGLGRAAMQLDLMNTTSWEEIVRMVAEEVKAARPGQWIYGRGWHQEKWTTPPVPNVEGFPTHASLDAVSRDNPVVLTHASGHASFVNGKAMELSGLTQRTPDPPGGEIIRNANGHPTGALRETASGLIRSGAGEPEPGETGRLERARRALDLAGKEALSKGITSFQDAGSSFADIDLMKAMVDEGAAGVRLWVMIRASNRELEENLAKYRMVDYGNGFLTVRAIKHSIDGALGSRGAWLLEPYADKPDSTGLNTTPVETIAATANLALEHGYQLCVHAIGDRANRETLDLFEKAFAAHGGEKDLRWRIEHAQHLHPADIPRFGRLGVIASMQGVHCTSDAPYVRARLGEKRAQEGAYMWQALRGSGAVIVNGTDAPVEDVDPIASYYSSVTRKAADGSVFFPGQRMTRLEALKSYTIDAAYAAFEEGSKGTLAPGKYADMVVLSKDILTIPEDEIPAARVSYTIVGGKVRYSR